MTTYYPDLYDLNLTASLARFLEASEMRSTYMFNYGDADFDAGNYNHWIEIAWVDFGGSPMSRNSFHARCFSRAINDRYGRERELMIGKLKNTLSVREIPLYDYTTNAGNPTPILADGEAVNMAIRFSNRSGIMDGAGIGESASAVKGVHVVVLSYNVYTARSHEQW